MSSDGNGIRIVLVGSVGSSLRTLEGLLRNDANVVGVLGLDPSVSGGVSGFVSLQEAAGRADIPFDTFENVNADDVVATVQAWRPDLIFVVGLSQLIGERLLSLPTRGCIGFHPTRLPRGRGRAPVAWTVLDDCEAAATFFLIDERVDAGPILTQEHFELAPRVYAEDVMSELGPAIDRALDGWLPRLLTGQWTPEPQDDAAATYYAKRGPRDGLITWSSSAESIDRLVRAAGRPHPGAYTYFRDARLIVWRVEPSDRPVKGVAGRILEVREDGALLTQTGAGLLWLTQVEPVDEGLSLDQLKVGVRLGYAPEDEIHALRKKVTGLEQRVAVLESQLSARTGQGKS